jgi:hypothetical protein
MDINMIPMTTDTQSSFGMSADGHAFRPCAGAAVFGARTVDLTQGEVALEQAIATRKGWVRGTYAWSPPTV